MRKKNATLLAFIGIAVVFLIRTVGTISPGLFFDFSVVRISTVLLFLSALAVLVFFVFFYTDHDKAGQTRLKKATAWAVAGMVAVVFMDGRNLLNIFNINFLTEILQSRRVDDLMPFIPWISSFLFLIFFVVFFKDSFEDERLRLRKALKFAVIGNILSVLLRTIIIVLHIITGAVRWVADLKGPYLVIGIIGIPLLILSFLAIEYFYLSFYKGRDIF